MNYARKFLHEAEELDSNIWFRKNKDGWYDIFIRKVKILDISPDMQMHDYKKPVINHKGETVQAYILGYKEAMRKLRICRTEYHKHKFENI